MLLRSAVVGLWLTLAGAASLPEFAGAQAVSNDPDLTRRREARMARDMARGRAFMAAGQAALAQRHFEDALRANPSAPQPYVELGRALSVMGRTTDAIQVLEAGRTRVPEDTALVSALADALVMSGRGYHALNVLRDASRRHRRDFDLQGRRGEVAQAVGAWSEAADAFAAVLDLAENGHPVPADLVRHAEASLRAIGILLGDLHPRARSCDRAATSLPSRWTWALAACSR